MNAIAIHSWLNGDRDFDTGVELLVQHGNPSRTLLKLLEGSRTSYTKDRLVRALELLDLKNKETIPVRSQRHRGHRELENQAAIATLSTNRDDWPISNYPEELQALKKQAIAWRSEQTALRGALAHLPSKEERFRFAKRIKKLDDQEHSAYVRLDTYRKTGEDIGSKPEKSPEELMKERNNLRSYISRGKKRGTSPVQMTEWQHRLNQIDKKLNVGDQK